MNRTSGLIILVNHSHLRSINNNNPFQNSPFKTVKKNKTMAQHPPSYGTNFTPTIHRTPSGPTDPATISLPAPFIVAIIGAGKGLGRQIALSYAKAGASGIVISSRTQADLDSLEGELKAVGGKKGGVEVWKKVCDVQNMKEVEEVARGTGEKFGRVDVVVSFFVSFLFSFLFFFLLYYLYTYIYISTPTNPPSQIANAGIISPYITTPEQTSSLPTSRLPIGLIEDVEFERILNTNLLGSWRVAYTFLPLLLSSKDGMQACILITSIASHLSHSSLTPVSYNLSKMGMNRLVEHIHRDHGERDGVQAFAVHPVSLFHLVVFVFLRDGIFFSDFLHNFFFFFSRAESSQKEQNGTTKRKMETFGPAVCSHLPYSLPPFPSLRPAAF